MEAVADAEACRQAIAQTGVFLLRLALDEYPAAVRELLADPVTDLLAAELPSAVAALKEVGATS
jgi:hypothetical protein